MQMPLCVQHLSRKLKKKKRWCRDEDRILLCISGDVMCSSRTRRLIRGKTHFIFLILLLSYYQVCDYISAKK